VDGTQAGTLPQRGLVTTCRFSPDGQLLAVVTTLDKAGSARLHVWDLRAQNARTLNTIRGNAIAFDPSGRFIAATVGSGTEIWDARTGERQSAITLPVDPYTKSYVFDTESYSLGFHPDGTDLTVARGGDVHRVPLSVHEAGGETGAGGRVFTGQPQPVVPPVRIESPWNTRQRQLAFLGDSRIRLLDWNRGLLTWDYVTGHLRRSSPPDGLPVRLSADGHVAAMASDSATWIHRLAIDGRVSDSRKISTGDRTTYLNVDGSLLLAVSSYFWGTIIWKTATGRLAKSLTNPSARLPTGPMSKVLFSPCGRYLAGTRRSGDTVFYRLNRPRPAETVPLSPPLAFSADGQAIAGYNPAERRAQIWSTRQPRLLAELPARAFPDTEPSHLVLAGRDRVVVTSGRRIQVWSTAPSVFAGDDSPAPASGRQVQMWETTSFGRERVLFGHHAEIWAIAASQDGRLLATYGDDGVLRIWDLDRGAELVALLDLPDGGSAAFRPDGAYKVIGKPAGQFWWANGSTPVRARRAGPLPTHRPSSARRRAASRPGCRPRPRTIVRTSRGDASAHAAGTIDHAMRDSPEIVLMAVCSVALSRV
jgi:WD40 repeat protein